MFYLYLKLKVMKKNNVIFNQILFNCRLFTDLILDNELLKKYYY